MERKHEEYILANLGKLHVKQIARDLGLKERTVRRFIETQKRGPDKPSENLISGKNRFPQARSAPVAILLPSPQEAFFRRFFLPIMLVLGCAAYSNTLNSTFHYDDFVVIVNNEIIKNLADPKAIIDAFNTRALAGFSFAANYALHKLDVAGYHLVNTTVHLGASALVWALVLALFRTPALAGKPLAAHRHLLAFFSGIIFALHPLQTQAVTYIWQRAASMATFFYLLSVVGYVRARTSGGFRAYAVAAVACLAAMFTKETSATLPLTLALVEAIFFASEPVASRAKRVAPFLLFLAVIPLTYMRPREATSLDQFLSPRPLQQPGEAGEKRLGLGDITRWESENVLRRSDYYLTELNVARTYLRLMVLPIRQSVVYKYPISANLTEPSVMASLLLHLGLLTLALRWVRTRPLLAFGIFWFYLNLLVEAAIPLPDVLFEHRAYLSMAGFALFVPAAALNLVRPRAAMTLLTATSLALGGATFARNRTWKNEFTLWSDAMKKFPDDPRPYRELGYIAAEQKDFKKAVELFEKTVALGSINTLDYANLGAAYLDMGDHDKALAAFEKVFASKNYHAASTHIAYRSAGAIYAQRGETDKALDAFEKAIQADPEPVQPYEALSILYLKRGNSDQAIAYSKKALQKAPDSAETNFNFGIVCHYAGQTEEARAQAEALRKLGRIDLVERLEGVLGGSPPP